MAQFSTDIQEHLKRWEGGFVNHPSDPGGATKYGITLRTWQKYGYDIDLDGDIDADDVAMIPWSAALEIYKARFWDRITGDMIANQRVAAIYFDMFVNAGNNAVKIMQRVLNQYANAGLVVDGDHGPRTLAAINSFEDQRLLHDLYRDAREDYYRAIVARRPSLGVFLKGWLRRVESFDYLKKKV